MRASSSHRSALGIPLQSGQLIPANEEQVMAEEGTYRRASCASDVIIFVRARAGDFPERAQSILSTWASAFPKNDVIFVSGENITNTTGANVVVDARIGADPLYGGHPVHDPLILSIALKELNQRPMARYIFIGNTDTFLLPENLCSYALPVAESGRNPFSEYIYAGQLMIMSSPWGANAMGTSCLQPGVAPREMPSSPAGNFAFAPSGILLSRRLAMDLGPYGEKIWNETRCIDAGDMRLWWGMYFHENDALKGRQMRVITPMDNHFVSFSPWAKYATYPKDYTPTNNDVVTFHTSFAATGIDESLAVWKIVQQTGLSALNVEDLILGLRQF